MEDRALEKDLAEEEESLSLLLSFMIHFSVSPFKLTGKWLSFSLSVPCKLISLQNGFEKERNPRNATFEKW